MKIKNNYIEIKKRFKNKIYKANKYKLLIRNKFKLDIIFCIIKNN